ncbi:sulfite exporter TauE/SafE family protein [Alphaproteobacteria bacterium]|nr:sulfite exporter TauE/SafE family protein [Alphaproteobacteria bacterium]
MFIDLDINTISVMLLAITVGGLLKGVISFGFPLIALPILSLVLPPKSAIFLLFFSLIFLNIREIKIKNWKSYEKIIPLGSGIFLGIIIGSIIFHKIESDLISKMIGLTIVLSAITNFYGLKINQGLLLNRWFSLLYGLFAGLIGGMTTIVGPLIVIYLVSLNLKKELFSEMVSLSVFSCLAPLYGIFFIYQEVTLNDFIISALISIPAVLMQILGFKIRNITPQKTFKNITLFILVIIGLLVLYKNW